MSWAELHKTQKIPGGLDCCVKLNEGIQSVLSMLKRNIDKGILWLVYALIICNICLEVIKTFLKTFFFFSQILDFMVNFKMEFLFTGNRFIDNLYASFF